MSLGADQILLVSDFFHPFDVLAVQLFRNRDMRHAGRGVAPCLCRWFGGHQMTSPARISTMGPPSHWVQPTPDVTMSVCPSGCVPGRTRPRFECDRTRCNARRFWRLDNRVNPHGPGEIFLRALLGGPCPISFDVHVGLLSRVLGERSHFWKALHLCPRSSPVSPCLHYRCQAPAGTPRNRASRHRLCRRDKYFSVALPMPSASRATARTMHARDTHQSVNECEGLVGPSRFDRVSG